MSFTPKIQRGTKARRRACPTHWCIALSIFIALTGLALLHTAQAFYLPGLAPVAYCNKQGNTKCKTSIPLYVNRLNSEESVIPFVTIIFFSSRNNDKKAALEVFMKKEPPKV